MTTACAYLQMVGAAAGAGVYAFRWLDCSELVPCQPPYNSCDEPGAICIHHPECEDAALCYPVSMTDKRICPTMSSETTMRVASRIQVVFMPIMRSTTTLSSFLSSRRPS